jgi:hypothetical protein
MVLSRSVAPSAVIDDTPFVASTGPTVAEAATAVTTAIAGLTAGLYVWLRCFALA